MTTPRMTPLPTSSHRSTASLGSALGPGPGPGDGSSFVMTRAPAGMSPAAAILLVLIAVGGRVLLDLQLGTAAGEVWQRSVEVLTALVTGAVVFHFASDDPPRLPWTLFFVSMVIVPLVRLLSYLHVEAGGVAIAYVLLIIGNFFLAGTLVAFGRVLGSSELLSERTRDDRLRATAFVATLALGAVATLAYNTFEVAERGLPTTLGAWVAATANLVSTLCDAFAFAGSLYLVWLVRPLIGGLLARPYILIAAAAGVFLAVDILLVAAGAIVQTDLVATSITSLLPKWLGCLAYTCLALAAGSQLALLRSLRH